MAREVRAEGVVVAVNRLPELRPDEVVAVCGWTGRDLGWFSRNWGTDPLLQRAVRDGVAVSTPASPVARLPQVANKHAVVAVLREPMGDGRSWQLVVSRCQAAFSESEVRRCGLLLQQLHASFVRPIEPELGHALLGMDGRVLGADLQTQSMLIASPDALGRLLQTVLPIVRQRYPDAKPEQALDVAVRMAGPLRWVRLRRRRPVDLPGAEHWHLEMRPLAADELPEVGVVGDERVAQAIGYLDAHYPESPSLARLAKAVHMSRFHFHRLFSQQVGVSPKQYLLRRQLQMARWLLRTRVLPVSAIAAQCGFATHGHFTSTFHRVVGESPTAYRERNAAGC